MKTKLFVFALLFILICVNVSSARADGLCPQPAPPGCTLPQEIPVVPSPLFPPGYVPLGLENIPLVPYVEQTPPGYVPYTESTPPEYIPYVESTPPGYIPYGLENIPFVPYIEPTPPGYVPYVEITPLGYVPYLEPTPPGYVPLSPEQETALTYIESIPDGIVALNNSAKIDIFSTGANRKMHSAYTKQKPRKVY